MGNDILPFTGFPKTKVSRDLNGWDSFEVEFRELTPIRAKVADRTGTLLALALSAAGVSTWISLTTAPDLGAGLALICGPLLLILPLRMTVRFLLRKWTSIRLSNDEIVLTSFMRQCRFDRNIDHAFALYPNDSEKEEAEWIEHSNRTRRGRPMFYPRYYAHSPHLVLEYLGHRNDLATITGTARAAKILGRLQGCDDHLRRQSANGAGLTFTPLDERGPRVGGLPTE